MPRTPPGAPPLDPVGGSAPKQFAKVVARRRQSGFLQLPCSLGFRLAFSATGGARLRPPAAFEKSGGKPAGKLLRFSGEICRPAAHGERRARFVCRKPRWKGVANGSFGRQKTATARGGGGVWRPGGPRAPGPAKQKSRGRRQSLAPAFQGASRPAAAPAHPNAFPLPHAGAPPAALWRLPMGSRGMGRTRGCFPPTPKGSKKGGGQTAPLPIRCL